MSEFKFNKGDRVISSEKLERRGGHEFTITARHRNSRGSAWYQGDDHTSAGGYYEEHLRLAPIGDPDDSPVEHPKHYNSHPSGVECITIARHHNFNIGNVFKYLWRIGLKGAKAATKAQRLEEIDKAIFYLRDERARIEAENE
ncbi:hypothetical protein SEA_TANDEM_62 [Microbacterium phage Tandem]|nr:hypothetical protein SEA_PIONEER3_62 [Microbacterium phage Pioneer3]AWY06392.1 hypothetical protein SEA_TANDEM_62 [Microbacterium phage Tandem]